MWRGKEEGGSEAINNTCYGFSVVPLPDEPSRNTGPLALTDISDIGYTIATHSVKV